MAGHRGLELRNVVGKQFQLLKEIVPNVSRFAAIWNPANPVWQATSCVGAGPKIFWTPARRIRIHKGAINTGA